MQILETTGDQASLLTFCSLFYSCYPCEGHNPDKAHRGHQLLHDQNGDEDDRIRGKVFEKELEAAIAPAHASALNCITWSLRQTLRTQTILHVSTSACTEELHNNCVSLKPHTPEAAASAQVDGRAEATGIC